MRDPVRGRFGPFDLLVAAILLAWAAVIVYPFWNALLVSVTSQADYARTPFMLVPRRVDLSAYRCVFASRTIWTGFAVTLRVVALGLAYGLFLTLPAAYALSRKAFPGKGLVLNLVVVTMYFSGGLLPFYLLVKGLGLVDTIFAMVLPAGLNTFYLLLARNYFATIPDSLEESAKLDGANDLRVFLSIFLPLSKPVLATVSLFYAVDRWNDWFSGMLFVRNAELLPLQAALRNVISRVDVVTNGGAPPALVNATFPDGIKMAAIFVTMAPVMLAYPFLQRHFMKGIMVGALKG